MVSRAFRTAAALAVLVALAPVARADNPRLADARRAIRDVRYDDARRLLAAALADGGNSRDELVEIYKLSAAAAVVLGDRELADADYRRMLALDPTASLSAADSPKLRAPFEAARAYMAGHGRLDAHIARTPAGIAVTVGDPLGMVASTTAIVDGRALPATHYAGAPVQLAIGDRAATVVLLDDYGNHLREVAAPPPDPALASAAPSSVITRWSTWAAPAAVALGVGIGFAVETHDARLALDHIVATSDSHFLSDADREHAREQRDAIISGVSFAAAGACAVTAIVLAVTHRAPRATVEPTLAAGQAGLAIAGRF